MTNYEKAQILLAQGKAEKHNTFKDTEIIYFLCTDAKNGLELCAYAYPNKNIWIQQMATHQSGAERFPMI